MNYEQKYKEALEKAKRELEACGSLDCDAARQIFRLFPELEELKESNIISALKFAVTYHLSIDHGYVANIPKSQLIAWLEKQDEQKSTNKEPKFKVGDWIVRDYSDNTKDVDKVVNVTPLDDGTYGYALEDDTYFSGYHEDKYRLWTIQDTKNGDVLVCEGKISKDKYGQEVGIVKKYVGRIGGCDNCFETYCFIDWEDNFIVGKAMGSSNIHPATKEQRDLLFQKMREAGYRWDSNRKELIGDEQQQ